MLFPFSLTYSSQFYIFFFSFQAVEMYGTELNALIDMRYHSQCCVSGRLDLFEGSGANIITGEPPLVGEISAWGKIWKEGKCSMKENEKMGIIKGQKRAR
jgi:hypothetical protein